MAEFDSLNNLTSESDELVEKQIRQYFEEMEITDEDKEKRISLALDIEKGFRNLFFIMLGAELLGQDLSESRDKYADYAYRRYTDAMVDNGYSTDENYEGFGYIEQYARQRCNEIVDTTILHRADSYYLSVGHSIAIGEDETNAVANYYNEQKAIAQGFTKKTWVTMKDKKVRHTHKQVDGETINIFDAFTVGRYKMLFPCDSSQGASMKEIANCRCVLKYSK